jgi:Family of unknown function (DUF5317)
VFPLYAVVIGLAIGTMLGGRISGLGRLRFRWAGLAVAGLLVQVALFAEPVAARIGGLGSPIYVASSVAVLVALLRNLDITGLRVVAVGAVSNLTAIVANGGSMPASPDALRALGKSVGETYSNSTAAVDPILPGLTDIYAMPAWLPFANVFSIGDVLIGVGIVITVVVAMRREGGAWWNRPHGHPAPVPMGHGTGAEPPIRSG